MSAELGNPGSWYRGRLARRLQSVLAEESAYVVGRQSASLKVGPINRNMEGGDHHIHTFRVFVTDECHFMHSAVLGTIVDRGDIAILTSDAGLPFNLQLVMVIVLCIDFVFFLVYMSVF